MGSLTTTRRKPQLQPRSWPCANCDGVGLLDGFDRNGHCKRCPACDGAGYTRTATVSHTATPAPSPVTFVFLDRYGGPDTWQLAHLGTEPYLRQGIFTRTLAECEALMPERMRAQICTSVVRWLGSYYGLQAWDELPDAFAAAEELVRVWGEQPAEPSASLPDMVERVVECKREAA